MAAGLAGCDGGVSGDSAANRPPDTALAVRDSSLVGNIEDEDRLTSTVFVSWSGTDTDGFVTAFDLRYYDDAGPAPGPEEGWSRTTRSDSLVLLPIPPESDIANVAFEVRAVDNEGAVDPTPARTVFPIRNSPPTFRLSGTIAPADTTWPVVSFGWTAADPDGAQSLQSVEIALNDPTDFIALPPEVDFITLVAANPQANRRDLGRDLFRDELHPVRPDDPRFSCRRGQRALRARCGPDGDSEPARPLPCR